MQQLFGQKVLHEFIDKQDEKLIENRWLKYKNFLAKKEKIATWIETDYQDGFLEDIFENCLGYISKTRSTNEHFTLEREKKNETNAQKADGALLVNDKVVAVIELKDLKQKIWTKNTAVRRVQCVKPLATCNTTMMQNMSSFLTSTS